MGDAQRPDFGQAAKKLKGQKAILDLMNSADAKRMMALLSAQGGVQEAAKAAAAGDATRLTQMMQQLMGTQEGAGIVERLTEKAKGSGLA